MSYYRYHQPLDPDCPAVQQYQENTASDPIMEFSGCADEFFAAFEREHRETCERCREFGVANIEVI